MGPSTTRLRARAREAAAARPLMLLAGVSVRLMRTPPLGRRLRTPAVQQEGPRDALRPMAERR